MVQSCTLLEISFELPPNAGYKGQEISEIFLEEYSEFILQDDYIWTVFHSMTNLMLLLMGADISLKKQGFERGPVGVCSSNRFEITLALAQELEIIQVQLPLIEVRETSFQGAFLGFCYSSFD